MTISSRARWALAIAVSWLALLLLVSWTSRPTPEQQLRQEIGRLQGMLDDSLNASVDAWAQCAQIERMSGSAGDCFRALNERAAMAADDHRRLRAQIADLEDQLHALEAVSPAAGR